MAKEPERHIFDNPRNVRLVLRLLYAACAFALILELFIHRHTEHPWEQLPGFYGIYGFVGIIVLVLAAKELRRLVLRREDYYDG